MLVHNAKVKLGEEFTRKEKALAVQQLIKKSKTIGEQRSRKLQERQRLMQDLQQELLERLSNLASNPAAYTELLAGLIVQGATKLGEAEVAVVCRSSDEAVAKAAVTKASAQLPGVSIALAPESQRLGPKCSGGVKVTGLRGKIVCDNTLEARARLSVHDLEPIVRYMLFPSSRAAPVQKPAV